VNLSIAVFLVVGVLFGLATSNHRHLFDEGGSRRRPGERSTLGERLMWLAMCAPMWPLFAVTGLYGAWHRQRAKVPVRVRTESEDGRRGRR
jgi:hypothetical protein